MYLQNIGMRQNRFLSCRTSGFTLLELIVSLILAAILGSILVTFMGTSLTGSAQVVRRVSNTYNIGKVMENMTADYKNIAATDATPLATFKSNVGTAGSGVISNGYGSYKVINNGYITFNCTGSPSTCVESAGGSSILKVTIADPDDTQTITALFTQ